MTVVPEPSWIDDLVKRLTSAARPADTPTVVGLCGPQGSGKTTAAKQLRTGLEAEGVATVILSLDDLYLPQSVRRGLARSVHPLLAVRGPPGTHDPLLGIQVLEALRRRTRTALPQFDKAKDDRAPVADWPVVEGRYECVVFEGWCVGAAPQPEAALLRPVNALEAGEDPEGIWRRYVNDNLAGAYQLLFDWVDIQVLLRPPGFEQVVAWRTEQEQSLRTSGRTGPGLMNDTEIDRFVQHYERLSRWIDEEMPRRADLTVQLDSHRTEISRHTH